MEANTLHLTVTEFFHLDRGTRVTSSIASAGEYRKHAIGQNPSWHSRGQSSHYVTNRKVLTRYLTAYSILTGKVETRAIFLQLLCKSHLDSVQN
jgi:hypothetical protein